MSKNAPNRLMGGEHDAARPSHAARSSPISNGVVRSFSTRVSIPPSRAPGLGDISPRARVLSGGRWTPREGCDLKRAVTMKVYKAGRGPDREDKRQSGWRRSLLLVVLAPATRAARRRT